MAFPESLPRGVYGFCVVVHKVRGTQEVWRDLNGDGWENEDEFFQVPATIGSQFSRSHHAQFTQTSLDVENETESGEGEEAQARLKFRYAISRGYGGSSGGNSISDVKIYALDGALAEGASVVDGPGLITGAYTSRITR